jgi:hypothetical protein
MVSAPTVPRSTAALFAASESEISAQPSSTAAQEAAFHESGDELSLLMKEYSQVQHEIELARLTIRNLAALFERKR